MDRNKEMSRKEQLEYMLERRQKLKEVLRLKMREENTDSLGVGCRNFDKDQLPYDDFGSFFGPSQPAISQRVLQECKSLLPEIHNEKKVEVVHDMDSKSKVKKLKENRDYSFLLSADSEPTALKKETLPESVKLVSNHSKPNPWEPRQPSVPSAEAKHMEQKGLASKVSDSSKKAVLGMKKVPLPSVPLSVKKQRPEQKKVIREPEKAKLNSKMSVGIKKTTLSKQHSDHCLKREIREPEKAKLNSKMSVGTKKAALSKQHSDHCQKREIGEPEKAKLNSLKMSVGTKKAALLKQHADHCQKREIGEPEKAKLNSLKMSAASSKPQSKPPKKVQTHVPMRPKKRPAVDDASAIIRGMFGYDPTKYAGLDEDDRNMETNFAELSKEEKRSERLAREEDKQQLRLIEEEARQEKLKKEAKRRKLSKSE